MVPLIQDHRTQIVDLCRRYRVQSLEVFGSAARGFDFDPVNSDVDFLVTYDLAEQAPSLEAYFGLTNDLAALLGRPVDLVMSGAVRNPFVRADIERSREPLYAA